LGRVGVKKTQGGGVLAGVLESGVGVGGLSLARTGQ
jgi:hypothetical protein